MRELALPALIVAVVLGLTGACVTDYVKAEPRTVEATIVDKHYAPGHYRDECDTDYIEVGDTSIPITTCHKVWVPPAWSVRYQELTSAHWTAVSQAIHDKLIIGQKVHAQFQEGGVFGIRYGTSLLINLPNVE